MNDDNTPPFIPVQTNKPGPLPGGKHVFLDPTEAIKKMTVAKGMKVNLFASEKDFPELVNPVQMTWDLNIPKDPQPENPFITGYVETLPGLKNDSTDMDNAVATHKSHHEYSPNPTPGSQVQEAHVTGVRVPGRGHRD